MLALVLLLLVMVFLHPRSEGDFEIKVGRVWAVVVGSRVAAAPGWGVHWVIGCGR